MRLLVSVTVAPTHDELEWPLALEASDVRGLVTLLSITIAEMCARPGKATERRRRQVSSTMSK